MNITKILVLLTDSVDKIFIYTDMPCPFDSVAIPGQQPLVLIAEATYDKGVEYVRKNFSIEPEVLNSRF